MEVGGVVQVSLAICLVQNRSKIALNQYGYFRVVYHVYSVHTLLKVVGFECSVHVSDGFQKK